MADEATMQLREGILSGELAPGSRLLLREQVERLSMSNLPVREALNRLEQAGLVEQEAHRGARVAPISLADMEDTYDLRILLEARAVRTAASDFAEDDESHSRARLDEYADLVKGGERAQVRVAHRAFHHTLYQAAGSRWLMRLIPILWDNSERYIRMTLPARGTPGQRISQHRDLLEACVEGDPDRARQLLVEHLELSVELVREQWHDDPSESAGDGSAP